ncbi:MAG: hypothetical protein CM15mV2_2110 [uncultured marine virus]|nr:MAG: hypothetical protein CM15mV2_2110 [uncultured marine virus]
MMRNQLLMLLHGRTIIKKKWSMRSQMKTDKKVPLGRKSNPYGKEQF